jgi:hypothetical protein
MLIFGMYKKDIIAQTLSVNVYRINIFEVRLQKYDWKCNFSSVFDSRKTVAMHAEGFANRLNNNG